MVMRRHPSSAQYLSDHDLCRMHVYAMASRTCEPGCFWREAARFYWLEIERRGYARD